MRRRAGVSAPADLAERLFRALFDDFDLIHVDYTYIAVPANGTVLAFYGSTLAEVAEQISETKGGTVPDPFAVDEGKALDALTSAWGDVCDEIWVTSDGWFAHRKDAEENEFLTADTPDGLNRAIRADFSRRAGQGPGDGS